MFMADETSYLGGPIPTDLKAQIDAQAGEFGWKIGRIVVGMAKLWAGLPPTIQAQLLTQSLDSNAFIDLIEQIVDQKIAQGGRDGEKIVARQKRKRSRKG